MTSMIQGTDGPDTLVGTDGVDTLTGGLGNDRYEGGAGNDLLVDNVFRQLDPVQFGDNQFITGGSDTYVLALGGGHDTIQEVPLLVGYDADVLELGAGISVSDLMLTVGGQGVVLATRSGQESMTIQAGGNSMLQSGIELVRFADGTQMNWGDFARLTGDFSTVQTGTSGKDELWGMFGNDTLRGLAGADELRGMAGNDLLDGGAGADTLTGGLGNDRSVGGKGNDVYVYGRGDGQDVIVDQDSTWFNSDVLRLGDITSRQLWLSRSGNDLQLSVVGTSDRVTIEGWYASSANRVEKIVASDGKTLTAARVNNLVNAMATLTPPAAGETTLSGATLSSLNTTLNRSWT